MTDRRNFISTALGLSIGSSVLSTQTESSTGEVEFIDIGNSAWEYQEIIGKNNPFEPLQQLDLAIQILTNRKYHLILNRCENKIKVLVINTQEATAFELFLITEKAKNYNYAVGIHPYGIENSTNCSEISPDVIKHLLLENPEIVENLQKFLEIKTFKKDQYKVVNL